MLLKKYVAPDTAEGVKGGYDRVVESLQNTGLYPRKEVARLEGAADSITTIQRRGLPGFFHPLPERFDARDVDVEGMTQDARNKLLLAAGKVGLHGADVQQTLSVVFGAEAISHLPNGEARSLEDRRAIVANVLRFATAPGLEANIHVLPPGVELSFDRYNLEDALTCYRRNDEIIGVSAVVGVREHAFQASEAMLAIPHIVERCMAEVSVEYPAIYPYDAAGQPLAPLELLGMLED